MKKIINMAHTHYEPSGPNQWPHILRVLSQATEISDRLSLRLTSVDVAALCFHDVAKSRMRDFPWTKDHGVASAALAEDILKGVFDSNDIELICSAIAEHDRDVVPSSSVSDLLISADANKPEILWIVRKSFHRSSAVLGLSGAERIENVFNRIKNHAVCSGRLNVPSLYARAFKNEISLIERAVPAIEIDDIENLVKEANRLYVLDDVEG